MEWVTSIIRTIHKEYFPRLALYCLKATFHCVKVMDAPTRLRLLQSVQDITRMTFEVVDEHLDDYATRQYNDDDLEDTKAVFKGPKPCMRIENIGDNSDALLEEDEGQDRDNSNASDEGNSNQPRTGLISILRTVRKRYRGHGQEADQEKGIE